VLLVAPRIHVSTAWAYSQITPRQSDPATPLRDDLLRALHRHAPLRIALANDFEPPVFARFSEIAAAKQALLDAGAVGAAMSGSGSSVFGLFTSEESAAAAARSVTMPGATVHVTPPFFTP
jgi:4-diphosphocytidyl-2-C-methyl-D-erythritol kinase